MIRFLMLYRNNIYSALSGILIGIIMKNIFLSMVFGYCFYHIPIYLSDYKVYKNKKAVSGSLHHSLNLITIAYMQSEDIVAAVTKNLKRIHGPLKDALTQFVAESNFVDVNLTSCLKRLKDKLDNKFFRDWCDTLIQCQHDRELKFVLMSHIEKMADVKKIQDELETKIMEVFRDFFSVMVVAFFSYPLMWFLNREWFHILSATTIGKAAVALTYLSVFLSIAHAFKINKPVSIS